jgi:hypothetical protein
MSNEIFPNKFKAALAAPDSDWLLVALQAISTEVLGLAGFDWLVLDGEHAPNDISTFIPQLMALKGSNSAPVVRVPTNEPVIIKRLLDIGFYNFLIPFVENVEEAVQAVASTRYRRKVFAACLFLTAPTCLAPCRTTLRSPTRTSLSWCRLRASRVSITSMPSRRPRALTVFSLAQAIWLPPLDTLVMRLTRKYNAPSSIFLPGQSARQTVRHSGPG